MGIRCRPNVSMHGYGWTLFSFYVYASISVFLCANLVRTVCVCVLSSIFNCLGLFHCAHSLPCDCILIYLAEPDHSTIFFARAFHSAHISRQHIGRCVRTGSFVPNSVCVCVSHLRSLQPLALLFAEICRRAHNFFFTARIGPRITCTWALCAFGRHNLIIRPKTYKYTHTRHYMDCIHFWNWS